VKSADHAGILHADRRQRNSKNAVLLVETLYRLFPVIMNNVLGMYIMMNMLIVFG